MTALYSFGLGIGTQNNHGDWLEVYYPKPLLNPGKEVSDILQSVLDYQGGNLAIGLSAEQLSKLAGAFANSGDTDQAAIAKQLQGSTRPAVATVLANDDAPGSVPEGYLKLHLLSHRLVRRAFRLEALLLAPLR